VSNRTASFLYPDYYDYYAEYVDVDEAEINKPVPAYVDYEIERPEEIPTRYRGDFKNTIPYEDETYPFTSKFSNVAKSVAPKDEKTKAEVRNTDAALPPGKHVGSDYYSFGYDPTDGAIGDDPPNESAIFGKVTYEYDFTNTHINPAVVGKETRSEYYAFPPGQTAGANEREGSTAGAGVSKLVYLRLPLIFWK
jgi:hypothetical protein